MQRAVRPLVAGNWKMHGLRSALAQARAVRSAFAAEPAAADVMICPPTTLLATMAAELAGSEIMVGGQDCHTASHGAYTGDVSAEMLRDAGAVAVIVGHSERRADHGETSALVRAKAAAANRAGLVAIVCIGETAGERRAGLTLEVVRRQLVASVPDEASSATLILAYEPVWAIGTGLVPTPSDIAEVHGEIKTSLDARFGAEARSIRVLYGGSVKPSNARELMSIENVDGALVGGASLKADDFLGIIAAYA